MESAVRILPSVSQKWVDAAAGYYLATLEAATQHICDLADQYEKVARVDGLFDDGEDIFEHFDAAD